MYTRIWFTTLLLCLSASSQEDRAAQFRALLAATPQLAVEQVPVASRMANASALGTVSSLAADRNGVIYALQRGDKADPVLVVDREGRLLRSWGKGMYTVPHSIRIDPEGNLWTVDAGSSVLLKFTPEGKQLQKIEVGEVATGQNCAFPGLCGTTDLTFAPGGRLFVSDGYGNARILEYTAAGRRVKAWGTPGAGPGQFQIPHGIATDGKVVFVADRGNARVQRFDLNGRYLGEWTHVGRPFALKLVAGSLWVATMSLEAAARGPQDVRASPWLLQVDPANGKVLSQAQLPGPHSIDVSESKDLYASGCCGGSSPAEFFWLHRAR